MNLLMDCLRLIVVKAIRGHTWVGDAVLDSPSSPADIQVKGARNSFISVYVDEADADYQDDPALYGAGAANTIRIILECGVASAKRFEAGTILPNSDQPAPPEGVEITQLDATDPGLELQMGLISRQALDALQATGRDHPWSEIFREFTAAKINRMEVRRGGPTNDGPRPAPRYASRVTIIHVGTIAEPPRGIVLDDYPVWKLFLDACVDDPEYGDAAQLIRAHLVRPSGPISAPAMVQKQLGVPTETVDAVGMTEPTRVTTREEPRFDEYDWGADVPPVGEPE